MIDTLQKRASASGLLLRTLLTGYVPDADLPQADRQQAAHSYSGILATSDIVIEPPTVPAGGTAVYPYKRLRLPEHITGFGGVEIAGPALSGRGTVTIPAAGAVTVGGLVAAGVGGLRITGDGGVAVGADLEGLGTLHPRHVVTLQAGSPRRTITGAGGLTVAGLHVDGVGAVLTDDLDRAWRALQLAQDDEELLVLGVLE